MDKWRIVFWNVAELYNKNKKFLGNLKRWDVIGVIGNMGGGKKVE